MTVAPAADVQIAAPLLYRVGEAARLLSISRSKAWELVARGEIESVKIDGARRISHAALQAYVARLAAAGDGG